MALQEKRILLLISRSIYKCIWCYSKVQQTFIYYINNTYYIDKQ